MKNFRWHDLRHTFGSRLAQAGVPILTIKELMGHPQITVTMRYAHLAPSNLQTAVPVLDQVPDEEEKPTAGAGKGTLRKLPSKTIKVAAEGGPGT